MCLIAQPVISEGDRAIARHYVTYALNLGSTVPGLEMRYTCFPGPGVVHPEALRDTVSFDEVTNLNVANLLGITLQVENRPRGTWSTAPDSAGGKKASADSRFFVDRLKVLLNLKTLSDHEPDRSSPDYQETIARYDAVVAATVDCILDNASRSNPPVRTIDLDVIGASRYARYARAYPIKASAKPKQVRF